MDDRVTGIDIDDLVSAYEAAARSAADASVAAAVTAFRAALEQRRKNRKEAKPRDTVLARYREGSWKRTVLKVILQLTESRNSDEFRFSDLSLYEKELRKQHPDQKALMSGVNVTLQGLVKDGVLHQSERGKYSVAF